MPENTKFKPRTFIDELVDVFSFFGEQKTPPSVQSYYTDPRYPTPMGPPAVPPGTTESGKFNIDLFNRVMRGDVSGVPQYIAQEAAQKATTAPKPTGMDFANPPGMVLPIRRNPAEDIVNAALDAGEQKARDQNRIANETFLQKAREQNRITNETFLPRARERTSGLLQEDGGFQPMDFLKRILAIMARPEFQDPEGISAGIVNAAYGLAQDEAAAAKVKREEQRLANEAAQLQFLNKLRLAEARREEERLRLAKEAAGKPKSTALPSDKIFTQGVINLVKRLGKDYISKESEILGPSKSDIAEEIAAEARSLVAASGGAINIREAVQEVLAVRQGKAPSSITGTSTDPFGDL